MLLQISSGFTFLLKVFTFRIWIVSQILQFKRQGLFSSNGDKEDLFSSDNNNEGLCSFDGHEDSLRSSYGHEEKLVQL